MKLKLISAMALMGLLFTACLKEENSGVVEGEGGQTTLRAGLPSMQSKTELDYANKEAGQPIKVYWSDGDKINVNGLSSLPLRVKEGEKSPTADFQLPSIQAPYYIVYPNDIVEGQEYDSDGTIAVQLPSVQAYSPTSFGSGAALMCGFSETLEGAKLQNLCAAIRVNIKGDDVIVDAKLASSSMQAPLCGAFRLAPKSGTLTAVDGKTELSLDIEEITLNDETGTDFFFTVPAGDYSEGLTFYFTRKGDRLQMQNVWLPMAPLQAGKLYSFNDVEYVPQAKDIETADEWDEFAAAMNSKNTTALEKYLHKGGIVRLGADIEVENLTSVTVQFPYIFDGNGKTIKRTAATSSLFEKLTGEIRNLTLDGELNLSNAEDAPFVKHISAGAKMTGCTNNMNVNFDIKTHCYVTGIAAVALRNDTEGLGGLEISDCTNNGTITGTIDVSSASYNVAIAGILGDVRASVGNFDYDVVLTNCKNTAPITLSPKSGTGSTYGMTVCGVGGILAYVRSAKSMTLNNCDNSGAITVTADYIQSETGLKATPTAVGGIVGLGTGAGSNKLAMSGVDFTLIDCDNTGTVYNCMVNASTPDQGANKVYTGGLAGALMGSSAKYATIKNCTNTGDVFTYDICSDDVPKPAVVSKAPVYCAVLGGFIGFGGHLDMQECVVNCQIGNGKRPVVSWGGVIGYTVRPFKLKDLTLTYSGYFQRLTTGTTYKYNRAVVAVVPAATEEDPAKTDDNIVPDISGSEITGYLKAAGVLKTATDLRTELDATPTTNLSSTLGTSLFNSVSKVTANLVNGGTADNNKTLMKGVTNTATINYSSN